MKKIALQLCSPDIFNIQLTPGVETDKIQTTNNRHIQSGQRVITWRKYKIDQLVCRPEKVVGIRLGFARPPNLGHWEGGFWWCQEGQDKHGDSVRNACFFTELSFFRTGYFRQSLWTAVPQFVFSKNCWFIFLAWGLIFTRFFRNVNINTFPYIFCSKTEKQMLIKFFFINLGNKYLIFDDHNFLLLADSFWRLTCKLQLIVTQPVLIFWKVSTFFWKICLANQPVQMWYYLFFLQNLVS